jgi:hypothetical protein
MPGLGICGKTRETLPLALHQTGTGLEGGGEITFDDTGVSSRR